MSTVGTGALTAALVALALGCSSQEQQMQLLRAEVQEAMARGDLDTVREALGELRKSEPDTPEAVRGLANLMVRVGEAPQALWLLQDGLDRFPERHDLRLLFARVALTLGEASRSLAALEPIDETSLFHPDAMVVRARATLELGKLDEALRILEEADELYPDLPDARRVRFEVLLQEDRFDEAQELLEQAKEQPTTDEGKRGLQILTARLLAARGEREEAVGTLVEMAREHPGEFAAWELLMGLLSRTGRVEDAVALLESALKEDPERLGLYPILGNALVATGQPDEAEQVYLRFVEKAESPSAYLELGRFRLAQGDPEGMLEVLEHALEEFPDQPMLQTARVETLLDMERVEEARAALEDMAERRADERPEMQYLRGRLELAEGNAEAAAERLQQVVGELDRGPTQLFLGRALEELGDYEGAQRRYGLAQSRAPGSPGPALALLHVAQRRSDWTAAAGAARRLIRFPAYRATGYQALVEALLSLGNLEQAEQGARRFVETLPDDLDAHLLLARALWKQERFEEAEEVLAEAEKQLGPDPEIAAERALALAASDLVGDGIAVLQRALRESPENTALLTRMATLHFENGDFEAGSELIDRATQLDPDDPEPLRVRMQYAAANGPLEVARRDGERYAEVRPEDANVHFNLGSVYARMGLLEKAAEAYRRAADLAEAAFAPLNNLAVLLQENGELDRALEAAHEAYARAETNPDVLDTLGWIYFEKGLIDRSIFMLEKAHEESPEAPGSQLHLALAYREAGRTDEARDLLSNVVARTATPSEIRREAEDVLRTLP